MLESAPDEPARIRALGRNHDLWSMLVKDLALEGNRLPEAIRSNLVALGLWSMRYSTLAILKNLPATPLIEVNRNIAEGLILQSQLPQQLPPNGKLEATPACFASSPNTETSRPSDATPRKILIAPPVHK